MNLYTIRVEYEAKVLASSEKEAVAVCQDIVQDTDPDVICLEASSQDLDPNSYVFYGRSLRDTYVSITEKDAYDLVRFGASSDQVKNFISKQDLDAFLLNAEAQFHLNEETRLKQIPLL